MQVSKPSRSGFKAVLFSILLCVAIYPLVSIVFSLFCYLRDDPLSDSGLFSLLSVVLSGALGGALSAVIFRSKFRKSIVCLLGTALVFFAFGLIFTKGDIPTSFFMNVLCYTLPFLLLTFMLSRRSSSGRMRKYKRLR